MDAAALLRQARLWAQLDQGGLATASGVGRATICRYERGVHSPTVRQLNRLLAGCGLRARVTLERLSAELDQQVAEVLDRQPRVDGRRLVGLADSFDALEVTWAVDGATALALQGIAVEGELAFAVVVDEHLRAWLPRTGVRATNRFGELPALAGDESEEQLATDLARGVAVCGRFLWAHLRPVSELPAPAHVLVEPRAPRDEEDDVPQEEVPQGPGNARQVPVLPVPAVLAAHPRWVELVTAVLARAGDVPSRA